MSIQKNWGNDFCVTYCPENSPYYPPYPKVSLLPQRLHFSPQSQLQLFHFFLHFQLRLFHALPDVRDRFRNCVAIQRLKDGDMLVTD